jgi:probable O-glycosylation ligase (exosortase A-associated)
VWWLYLASTIALIYIAYEMNFLYIMEGRLDIYHNGYGGLDNNGAALMLAMGVPLAMSAWEASTKIWRWAFIAAIPLLLHAVMMSYSRGAMVSLLVVTPFLILRSRKRLMFGVILVALIATVPYLAGREIRQRFFSVQEYTVDESAQSRFDSWDAAFKIANDYPIFGVGIRNSNLLTYSYGADIEGRAIHSQYLQTMADSGYVGLALYLVALASVWVSMMRTRSFLRKSDHPDAPFARSLLSGVEGAMVVFCFGGSFLSLEVFELPYLVALMAAQVSLLTRVQTLSSQPSASPEPSYFAARGINDIPGYGRGAGVAR